MKASKNTFIAISLLISFYNFNCKKANKEDHEFDAIQASLAGKWKLEYIKGGVIANYVMSFHNESIIWHFHSVNRILENYNGMIYTDTTISWRKEVPSYTGPELYNIMSFYDKRGYPYIYAVESITNDSLVLHDNALDGQSYQFSKFK